MTENASTLLPLCKDCEHSVFNAEWENYRCLAEQNIARRWIDLVIGIEHLDVYFKTCIECRAPDSAFLPATCGPTGRWFEQTKQPEELAIDDLDLDLDLD